MSKPLFQRVLPRLEREESYGRIHHRGYITVLELIEMVQHHAVRQVSASTCLGLTYHSAYELNRFVNDEFLKGQLERYKEKTGRDPEVSISISEVPRKSGMTYTILVHGLYAFTSDERTDYYPIS